MKSAYPNWCCQQCGERIGWLGQCLERMFGSYHDCEDSAEYGNLYHELILAVDNKYPDENRHQTALRFIREGQQSSPADAR